MTTARQPRQPDGPLVTYTPENGTPDPATGNVFRKQIILLTDQSVIANTMTVQELIDYIALISDLTTGVFADCPVTCDLLLEITFQASQPPALAAFSTEPVSLELTNELYAKAAMLPPTNPRNAPVHIQLVFGVTSAAGS
jgi:hypothetical protein